MDLRSADGHPLGQGATDYERAVNYPALMAVLWPPAERVNEDALLFQVTHQAAELWMAVALADVDEAVRALSEDRFAAAARTLRRVARIVGLLAESILLLETMPPANYHAIRATLGRGSGQDSPGFNFLLHEAPRKLWPVFKAALDRHQATPLSLLEAPADNDALYQALQGLMEFDERFMEFRSRHYLLVRRIIGTEVVSLKGIPARQLEAGTHTPLFPELWEPIGVLTRKADEARAQTAGAPEGAAEGAAEGAPEGAPGSATV